MNNEENKTTQNSHETANSSGQSNQSDVSGKAVSANENASTAESVKNSAHGILEKAKDSAGQAYDLATDKATSKIAEQKSNLAGGLSGVADSLRQVGKAFSDTDQPNVVTDLTSKYGEVIAEQLDSVSDYFEQTDLREIIRDVENFARRQPLIFIGGAFAAGLLAARFLKSSGDGAARQPRKLTNRQPSANHQSDNQNKQPSGQTAVSAS